ncbi:HAD-IC family P-type ATPase [candidate division WWE3 bacterium]|uniref:HAD-IC family P-type ATPase n=1 Tax=candidate division WWE3 bacterium TaxID=2053526 RepID=A0A955RS01_UNCKA|nr:HAD-IC family P-type ATPase [candidate division WWE3 bacterium]
MNAYNVSVADIFKHYNLDPKKGLNDAGVKSALEEFGLNRLPEEKVDTKFQIFLRQFTGPLIPVLVLAMFVTLFLKEFIDATVITITIAVSVVLSFIQEFKAQESVSALKKLTTPKANVLRSGQRIRIDSTELVPGDILLLEEGDAITADARLIVANNLGVDESVITGESQTVSKDVEVITEDVIVNDQDNMVFAGTSIVRGDGRAVVVATGANTQIGKIAKDVSVIEKGKTPLQISLERLGRWLLLIVGGVCIAVFGIGVLTGKDVFEMFLFAVSLAVSVLPEDLVVTVTIALAVGMTVMAKRKAIMRSLAAVETLGAVSVIATDKTGTLTFNKLTLQQVYVDGVRTKSFDDLHNNRSTDTFLQTALLANNAQISDGEGVGDPLDAALLNWMLLANLPVAKMRTEHERLAELPFSTDYRMMGVLSSSDQSGKAYHLKGSPHEVLERCREEIFGGKVVNITDERRNEILTVVRDMASEGLKPLVFAYLQTGDTRNTLKFEDLPKDLVFTGVAGFADELRPEAKEAVALVQSADIRVLMLTGDHRLTASVIGRTIGISNSDEVLKGNELDTLSDDEIKERLKYTNVFARVTPHHKLMIIKLLQEMGDVVAMTGDGVNDAPALAHADIGVAMGEGGTDVARGASDMVILDNNFVTIKSAIEEGRAIFDNLKRVVAFLLSTNASEVFLMVTTLILGMPLPLYPTQILWLNLVTDGFPDAALIFGKKDPDILQRKPRNIHDFILDKPVLIQLFVLGTSMAFIGFVVFIFYEKTHGIEYARTATLIALAFLQLMNAYNIQGGFVSIFKTRVFSNRFLTYAVLFSAIIQVAVVEIGFLRGLFHTVPIAFVDWVILILASLLVVAVNELFLIVYKVIEHR